MHPLGDRRHKGSNPGSPAQCLFDFRQSVNIAESSSVSHGGESEGSEFPNLVITV